MNRKLYLLLFMCTIMAMMAIIIIPNTKPSRMNEMHDLVGPSSVPTEKALVGVWNICSLCPNGSMIHIKSQV